VALFGRGPQTDALAALIGGVRAGRGGAVLVRGAPGIGKSALLASAQTHASAAGFTVVRVFGEPAGSGVPYAGLQQFAYSLGVKPDTLAEPQRSALTMALGAGEATVPDVFLVGLATLNLVAEAAERAPVLLVADDLQWLDDPTISILAFMARRVRTEPVLLLGAAREGYRERLAADELTTLTLPPLSDADAESLLDATAPGLSPAVRRRVLSEAAGNPLALTELSRAVTSGHAAPASALPLTDALPLTERLERAFTDRLATLPGPTGMLLRVAAVNDSPALAENIAAARAWTRAPIGPEDLDPAVSAMLVDVVGTEVRFRHTLMRSAIHQSMTAADQRAVHAVLAQVLPADQEDRRIRHQAAATALPDEAVAARLAAVADRAARRGGVAAAVDALSRAAALSEDPESRTERLLRAADFAVELGQQDTVGRLLEEAAMSGLTVQQQVKVAWLRGSFDEGLGQQASNATMLTALAEEVAAGGDVALAVRILWSAAQLCFWSEPGAQVRQLVLDAAEKLPLDDLDPWLLAILAYVAPVSRGAVVAERARRVAPRAGDDGRAYRMLSTGALLCGAFELSREFSAAAATALRAQGRLGLLARVVGAEAWSATVVGDLGAAIVACDESRRLARETSQQLMYALMTATAAKLAALRGESGKALALAEEAEEIGLPAGARPALATALMARGLAALGDGRFDEAYGHFRRLHDPADPAFQIALRLTSLGDLVDAATHCGQAGQVRAIVAELAETATQTPAPVLHADLRLARAMLAADDEAEALFEAALRADLSAWPLIRSRTQLAFGEWLRRHRRALDSRDHLRTARDMFDALGAIPWSERARRELRATGEASRHRDPDARDQLTPHELQIAQLAAEGLTNREIGQRLYLSHRTVSSHLHRIFPKLGVASRSELRMMVGLSS
jgi:DNA-binding CsgD family transcriptional regulator